MQRKRKAGQHQRQSRSKGLGAETAPRGGAATPALRLLLQKLGLLVGLASLALAGHLQASRHACVHSASATFSCNQSSLCPRHSGHTLLSRGQQMRSQCHQQGAQQAPASLATLMRTMSTTGAHWKTCCEFALGLPLAKSGRLRKLAAS